MTLWIVRVCVVYRAFDVFRILQTEFSTLCTFSHESDRRSVLPGVANSYRSCSIGRWSLDSLVLLGFAFAFFVVSRFVAVHHVYSLPSMSPACISAASTERASSNTPFRVHLGCLRISLRGDLEDVICSICPRISSSMLAKSHCFPRARSQVTN